MLDPVQLIAEGLRNNRVFAFPTSLFAVSMLVSWSTRRDAGAFLQYDVVRAGPELCLIAFYVVMDGTLQQASKFSQNSFYTAVAVVLTSIFLVICVLICRYFESHPDFETLTWIDIVLFVLGPIIGLLTLSLTVHGVVPSTIGT
jgi:hypothetical protein